MNKEIIDVIAVYEGKEDLIWKRGFISPESKHRLMYAQPGQSVEFFIKFAIEEAPNLIVPVLNVIEKLTAEHWDGWRSKN